MTEANGSHQPGWLHRRYSVEMIGRAREEFLDIVRRAETLELGAVAIEAYQDI